MSGISGVSPQVYQANLLGQQGFQSRYIPGSMVDTSLFQTQPVQPAQTHHSSPGFFSKIGATLKGLANVPETLGRAVLNPKNLLIGAAAIGACCIPLVGPFIAGGLIAYGLGSSAVGVARGVGNTVQGWANGDLAQIEQGATEAGMGVATGAASVFGARAFVRQQFVANPTALARGGQGPVTVGGQTITEAGQIGYGQAVRLMPRYLGHMGRTGYGQVRAFTGQGFSGMRDSIVTAFREGGAVRQLAADTRHNFSEWGRVGTNRFNRFERGRQPLPADAGYRAQAENLFARESNRVRAYGGLFNQHHPGVLPGIAGNLDA